MAALQPWNCEFRCCPDNKHSPISFAGTRWAPLISAPMLSAGATRTCALCHTIPPGLPAAAYATCFTKYTSRVEHTMSKSQVSKPTPGDWTAEGCCGRHAAHWLPDGGPLQGLELSAAAQQACLPTAAHPGEKGLPGLKLHHPTLLHSRCQCSILTHPTHQACTAAAAAAATLGVVSVSCSGQSLTSVTTCSKHAMSDPQVITGSECTILVMLQICNTRQACQRSWCWVSLHVVQTDLPGCMSRPRANNGCLPAGLHCHLLLAVAEVCMLLSAPLRLDQNKRPYLVGWWTPVQEPHLHGSSRPVADLGGNWQSAVARPASLLQCQCHQHSCSTPRRRPVQIQHVRASRGPVCCCPRVLASLLQATTAGCTTVGTLLMQADRLPPALRPLETNP